jgi:hypothetical protein
MAILPSRTVFGRVLLGHLLSAQRLLAGDVAEISRFGRAYGAPAITGQAQRMISGLSGIFVTNEIHPVRCYRVTRAFDHPVSAPVWDAMWGAIHTTAEKSAQTRA